MAWPMILWKDGQVLELDADNFDGSEHFGLFCLDVDSKRPAERYGKFFEDSWHHIPFDEFPPEFKTALLLLGVT